MVLHKNNRGSGVLLSPLDLLKTAVNGTADWLIKKEVNNLDGYLEELWVEGINTTNGDTLAMQFSFIRATSLVAYASEWTDLGQPIDNQPNRSEVVFVASQEYLLNYGSYMSVLQDIVIIDRDYIYITWAGQHDVEFVFDRVQPYGEGIMLSSIEKSHAFSDGIIWAVTNTTSESFKEVFYDGSWYGDTVVSTSNKQSRLNAAYGPEVFNNTVGIVDAFFYTSCSVHVNLDLLNDNTQMILLGFIPGGVFVIKDSFKTVHGLFAEIDGADYIGYPSVQAENTNVMLFPQ